MQCTTGSRDEGSEESSRGFVQTARYIRSPLAPTQGIVPLWAHDDPSDKIWFYHRRADLDAAIAGPMLRSWGGKELLAASRGVVDTAAQPYIIAFDYPVKELKYVFRISHCRLETRIINQYFAQTSSVAPEDTAFESSTDKPVEVEETDIILARDARFSALSNYCDELHFQAV